MRPECTARHPGRRCLFRSMAEPVLVTAAAAGRMPGRCFARKRDKADATMASSHDEALTVELALAARKLRLQPRRDVSGDILRVHRRRMNTWPIFSPI